jgi:hypothetical protein
VSPFGLPKVGISLFPCFHDRLHLRRVHCTFPHVPALGAVSLTLLSWQLVIEKSLSVLPKRQTDGATIIRSQDSPAGKAVVFKLNANQIDPVLVERYEVTPAITGSLVV